MGDSQIDNSLLSELIALQKRLADIDTVLKKSKALRESWPEAILALSRLIEKIKSGKPTKQETVRHVITLVRFTIDDKIVLVDSYINEGRIRNIGSDMLNLLSNLLQDIIGLMRDVQDLESKL